MSNLLQRFFDKIIIQLAEPQNQFQKNVNRTYDQLLYHNKLFINKMRNICRYMMREVDDSDAESDIKQSDHFTKLLPELGLIEYILHIEQLLSIEEFANMCNHVPAYQYYNEQVFPIPYDYVPLNLFDSGRYDVNIVLGQQNVPYKN